MIHPPAYALKAGMVAGFSTRGSGDFLEQTVQHELLSSLGMERLRLLSQVHGSRLVDPDGGRDMVEADGWAGVPPAGTLLGIKTADCLPLLIWDEKSGRVAAVHAGWRGAVDGIVPKAVKAFGCDSARLTAALGPSIGPCCYEVGEEVARHAGSGPLLVVGENPGKYMFDLPGYVAAQLAGAGLKADKILRSGLCTLCDGEDFFSHRGGDTGRLCSFIGYRDRG